MMSLHRVPSSLIVMTAVFAGSGCTQSAVDCGAADAMQPLVEILKSDVEEQVTEQIRSANRSDVVSRSNIRASISQVSFLVEDVRTSKEDPNSTKRFCTGVLRVKFPVRTIDDAEAARSSAELGGLTQLADDNAIDRQANSFLAELEYSVQPTDEGDKVFAETETRTPVLQLAAEVLSSALLRTVLEQGARAQEQAMVEQQSASLDSAKIDNQLAAQTILATWRALPDGVRSQYLPAQRAWSRKKDADCRVEAAGVSTDPAAVETARLTCDTRATQDRTAWLDQIRASSVTEMEPTGGPAQASEPVEEAAFTEEL